MEHLADFRLHVSFKRPSRNRGTGWSRQNEEQGGGEAVERMFARSAVLEGGEEDGGGGGVDGWAGSWRMGTIHRASS